MGIFSKKNKDVEAGEEAGPTQQGWHVMDVDSVANFLEAKTSGGLTAQEAARRLELYGPNQLTEKKKTTIWERIWRQINNILVLILIIVAIISGAKAATETGDSKEAQEARITGWIEVVLIVGVIVLNTWIGIRQEGSAEKSAEALKAMLSSTATVVRDGKKMEIDAKEVVIGDLVELNTGDRIPADLRMIKASNLACQEAALTGEALPVDKSTAAIAAENPMAVPLGDRKNMSFSATLVSQGYGLGIVVATGDNTEIGEINSLVSKVEKKKTNVLIQIDMVSKFIAAFVILTAITTFLVAYLYTGMKPMDAVNTALVTAVAMIPEGLAAIVTLAYGFAVNNMAKHNAIIRMLPAVETLGSVTVICSDKTGTLTKNEMSMIAFVTSNGRFKFDTDSKEITNTNFVREDSYMAHNRNEKKGAKGKGASMEQIEQPQGGSDITVAPAAVEASGPEKDLPVKNGESPELSWIKSALAGGSLCSHATLGKDGGRDGEIGNPTELAITRAAYFGGVNVDGMRADQQIITQVPFSSEYKFMATVHKPLPEIDGENGKKGLIVHVKGAPDRLIAQSSHQCVGGMVDQVEEIDRDYWMKQAANLSQHGLRVLALCRAECTEEEVAGKEALDRTFVDGRPEGPWLTMVGLCAIMDPPRPECIDAIKVAHGAGVRVAMITGDHQETALAIGDMLGIVDKAHPDAITGPALDAMSDDELRVAVMKYNVFARASPENKIRIVKALQAEKQVSSMTGDGVNDAPALRAADMGVAMGKEGTDVAREAAEMILADDNFATIVAAVREGRVVWDNLRKILLFNTPVNNAQGLTVLVGMISGLEEPPLTPIQVLYCNLICAVTLGMVLAVEPAEDGIMTQKPRRVGKRLIGRFLLLRIVIGTIVLVATTVGSVWWIISMSPERSYTQNQIHSQASNTLTFGAISVCLSARFAHNSSMSSKLLYGNKYAWYSVFLTALLQVCITYIPGLNNVVFQMEGMDGVQWGLTFLGMTITFLVMEFEKWVRRKLQQSGVDVDDTEEDPLFDGEDDFVHNKEEDELTEKLLAKSELDAHAVLHNTTLHR